MPAQPASSDRPHTVSVLHQQELWPAIDQYYDELPSRPHYNIILLFLPHFQTKSLSMSNNGMWHSDRFVTSAGQ